MLWWCLAGVAFASGPAPRVVVDFKGDNAVLELWSPLGVEVATDAPAVVELSWAESSLRWSGSGAGLERGVRFGGVRGQELVGQLSLSMCNKSDGTCVPRTFSLQGFTADRRRGQAVLRVQEAEVGAQTDSEQPHPVAHGPEYQTDAAAIAEAAFEAARADGKRVILDFGAVWCPPCNLLSAEVLHAADPPGILDEFHLAVLDVDDPRSFELKSRYEVGGYPTVVVVDAEGAEISRQVGYPGREEVVDWLVRAAEQQGVDTDFSEVDPATVEPWRAAEIAWLLAQGGADGVERWLVRAESAADRVELHLARMAVEPTLEEARWLADHAPGTAMDWVYGARKLAEEEEGRLVLRRALEADLRGTKGPEAADLLYLLAETASEADQPLLYGSAAAALRTALTGDPTRDKGHLTWLAVLTERSGDVAGAVELLEDGAERWPEEPTFHLALASNHLRNDRAEDSLIAAEAAVRTSWGDNELRAVEAACKALGALGRADDAAAVAKTALAEHPAPEEGLKVRTFRYREKLQKWADGKVE